MKKCKKYLDFFWRVCSAHVVSYMIMGILASFLFNYSERFVAGTLRLYMLPTDSPLVALGPALQIIRGLIFTVVLWPVKNTFIEGEKGWLKLWVLFIGLAILGTAGPTPGSIEGMIYTRVSMAEHIFFLPEVVLQTLVFSIIVYNWYKRPSRVWNLVMGILFGLTVFFSTMGYFFA
ncbi:MAG: hypothetical protein QM345_00330 [Bacillota bacterium]|nr:hypothetical protein [Bacillota bacterium]